VTIRPSREAPKRVPGGSEERAAEGHRPYRPPVHDVARVDLRVRVPYQVHGVLDVDYRLGERRVDGSPEVEVDGQRRCRFVE